MKKYVTIDIGGTSIKHGVIQDTLQLITTDETDTQAQKGGPHIVQTVLSIIQEYQKLHVIDGICISTAGMVDIQRGEIVYAAPLIPDYAGTAWKQIIQQKIGLACEVENDVNCAGLSEYHIGAARGASSCLCLTIGTGIGGCFITHGAILHGQSYSACEIGHLQMFDTEFQKLASTTALVQNIAQKKKCAATSLNGKIIFNLAKQGDADCIQAIDKMIDILGYGIANLCYCFNPETIVLGGGIMAEQSYLETRIRAALDRHLIPYVAQHTRITFAKNKNHAGLLGAYIHFMAQQKGGVGHDAI